MRSSLLSLTDSAMLSADWSKLRIPAYSSCSGCLDGSTARHEQNALCLQRTLKEARRLRLMDDYDQAVDIGSVKGTEITRGWALQW